MNNHVENKNLQIDLPIILLYEMDMESWIEVDRQNVIDLVAGPTNSMKEIRHSNIIFK